MIAPSTARQNPFPGLRPFREDETHLFFGRENQVDTMVNKLAATRFLGVVGTSGSGKSSLVNCGLRPALHRGLMASAGPAWRIAQFRPGSHPIKSLAQALATDGVLYSVDKKDIPLDEIIETYLHQSASGVVDTFRKARLPQGTNLLIVADQFEELFRYSKLETAAGSNSYAASEKAIAFVNLLLKAAAEPGYPIYVVITMRSDFLGDCSQFYGLPEAINRGQYLVPRMTRDERRASIAGPVSVGGAEISPVLLTRLVNDVGDNPDQLSILQHALNRTWDRWERQGAKGELDLEHYTAIGTMSEALNQHADQAFELLETPQKKRICEKLFSALTDLGTDARGIRRPLKLAALTEIAATSGEENQVKEVIEVFRDPSRAFLMPPAGEPLEPHRVIDISHESLMRVWKRLRKWAEEESVSARRYRRLAETAALEKTRSAALWSDPDLQVALDWKEEQAPSQAWSNLYGGDFESAVTFLERSRSKRDHALAEVIFKRHWKPIKWAIVFLVVGIFLLRLAPDRDHAHQPEKKGVYAVWSEKFDGLRAPAIRSVPPWGKTMAGHLIDGLVFASFFGPYVLGYLAIDYSGKWAFRRLAFAKILQKVALSSTKAEREKLVRQPSEDALVGLQTTYASSWRRLGAYALDLGLFLGGSVVFFAVSAEFAGPLGLVPLLMVFVAHWLYHSMMLSSRRQATLGMLALGIFVTDQSGHRLHFGRATARHVAKVFSVITLGIASFVQPFSSKRQTVHDLISSSVVRMRIDTKKVPWWLVVICLVVGSVEAVLVGWSLFIAIIVVRMSSGGAWGG